MSKLFNLKNWLTLEEAAAHLSGVLNENVAVEDLLRLALNGHLTISINIINGAEACKGERFPLEEFPIRLARGLKSTEPLSLDPPKDYPADSNREAQMEWLRNNEDRLKSGELIAYPACKAQDGYYGYDFEDRIVSIRGLWDLPMIGNEILDIEHLLQGMIGGPEVTGMSLEGTMLVHPDGVTFARLMDHYSKNEFVKDGHDRIKYPWGDPRSYYPSGGLPNDEKIVVRTEKLTQFLSSLQEASGTEEKPLGSRERRNILRIVAGLAEYADIDLRSEKAAGILANLGSKFGGPDDRTTRKYVAEIVKDILDDREPR